MEVQQRALTKEAYDFWLQLKKTTESLGSLFDPFLPKLLETFEAQQRPRSRCSDILAEVQLLEKGFSSVYRIYLLTFVIQSLSSARRIQFSSMTLPPGQYESDHLVRNPIRPGIFNILQ
jgi:hypothetical protein